MTQKGADLGQPRQLGIHGSLGVYRTVYITSPKEENMKSLIAVPATLALVYRAWSRNSLTPLGIVVAAATAAAHAVHPWSVFFALLVVFFLAGTSVTKACLSAQPVYNAASC